MVNQKLIDKISLIGFEALHKENRQEKRFLSQFIINKIGCSSNDINNLFKNVPIEHIYVGLNNVAFRRSKSRSGIYRFLFRFTTDVTFSNKLKSQLVLSELLANVVIILDGQFKKVNRNYIVTGVNKLVVHKKNHLMLVIFIGNSLRRTGYCKIGDYILTEEDRRHHTRIVKVTKGEQ